MTNFKHGSVSLILAHYAKLVCNFLTLERPFSLPYLKTLDSNSVPSSKDVAPLGTYPGKKGPSSFRGRSKGLCLWGIGHCPPTPIGCLFFYVSN